jgi:hypothetical protein
MSKDDSGLCDFKRCCILMQMHLHDVEVYLLPIRPLYLACPDVLSLVEGRLLQDRWSSSNCV